MDLKDLEKIWEPLINDYNFFAEYSDTFVENFRKHLRDQAPSIIGTQGIATLIKKLYIMLFSFQRDPREELFNLAYRLNQYEIDLKKILTQTTLLMVRDYIDYIVGHRSDIGRVKKLLELIEIYLSVVEDAQAKYLGELRREVKKQKKAVAEGERSIIIDFLKRLKDSEKDDLEFISYYKQVPVVCRSRLIDVGETTFRAKICNLPIFKVGEEVYLKHPRLPRTVAVKISELDHTEETGEFEVIGFVDLPQERRRYVRVQPEDRIPVKIRKGDEEIIGEIADISVGGIGVYVKEKRNLNPGDVISVSFELPGGLIETNGVIRHITPHENLLRVGIEYRLDFKKEEIVSDYVMERQFEILRELKGLDI